MLHTLKPFSILGLMLLMVSAPSMVLMMGSSLYVEESDWSSLRYGAQLQIWKHKFAQQQLHYNNCTTTIAKQQLPNNNCTTTIALQQFDWKNCIKTLHCCVDLVAITTPQVVCSPSSGWPAVGTVSTFTILSLFEEPLIHSTLNGPLASLMGHIHQASWSVSAAISAISSLNKYILPFVLTFDIKLKKLGDAKSCTIAK